jgi:hypothetical protein
MALQTDSDVTRYVQSILNDTREAYFTTTEIDLWIDFAINEALERFAPWLYYVKKKSEDLSLVADQSDYDKPDDCYKVSSIRLKDNGDKIRFIGTEKEFFDYKDYDPSMKAWHWVNGKIQFIPTPDGTSDTLSVWYMPELTSTSDFPPCIRNYIAILAVINGLGKDERITNHYWNLLEKSENSALRYLVLQTDEAEMMQPFCEEDGYAY